MPKLRLQDGRFGSSCMSVLGRSLGDGRLMNAHETELVGIDAIVGLDEKAIDKIKSECIEAWNELQRLIRLPKEALREDSIVLVAGTEYVYTIRILLDPSSRVDVCLLLNGRPSNRISARMYLCPDRDSTVDFDDFRGADGEAFWTALLESIPISQVMNR